MFSKTYIYKISSHLGLRLKRSQSVERYSKVFKTFFTIMQNSLLATQLIVLLIITLYSKVNEWPQIFREDGMPPSSQYKKTQKQGETIVAWECFPYYHYLALSACVSWWSRGALGVGFLLCDSRSGFPQCFETGWDWIGLDLIRSVDPNPDPDLESESGSKRAKMTHKNRKKLRNFMFWKFWNAVCSLLRADGFFCSLDVLYGGLGIRKLQLLTKKISIFFQL